MGHQGFASRTRTKKRFKDKHKSLGLCVECSNKAKKNRTRCKFHLGVQKIYRDKIREERK